MDPHRVWSSGTGSVSDPDPGFIRIEIYFQAAGEALDPPKASEISNFSDFSRFIDTMLALLDPDP